MNDILFTPIRLNELETLIQNSVRKALNERHYFEKGNQPEADQLLSAAEAADLLDISVPTIYAYVHRQEIPVNKRGKRIYFSKQELIEWIKAGRKKTVSEIEAEAVSFLTSKKKGGKAI